MSSHEQPVLTRAWAFSAAKRKPSTHCSASWLCACVLFPAVVRVCTGAAIKAAASPTCALLHQLCVINGDVGRCPRWCVALTGPLDHLQVDHLPASIGAVRRIGLPAAGARGVEASSQRITVYCQCHAFQTRLVGHVNVPRSHCTQESMLSLCTCKGVFSTAWCFNATRPQGSSLPCPLPCSAHYTPRSVFSSRGCFAFRAQGCLCVIPMNK